MGTKSWSRFTVQAPVSGVNVVYKGSVSITSPSTFVPIPFPLFDTTYHVRYSAYVGNETVGCDVLPSEQEINGFWAHPAVDCTIRFEIIV